MSGLYETEELERLREDVGAKLVLRPHQVRGIEMLRERMRAGDMRIVLEMCTGSGKTEAAIAMLAAVVAKGGKGLFCVNRTQLLEQTVRRFRAAGLDPGLIQSDATRDTHKPVVVASIQTLARRWHELPDRLTLVLIDEGHSAPGSESYRKLIHRIAADGSKTVLVALTATPWAPGMGKHYEALGGPLFQSKVSPTTAQELIDAGFLVDCDIYAPHVPDMTGVKVTAGEWDDDEAAKKLDQPGLVGDIVTTWLKYGQGKQTVAFACNIAHSQHIAEGFQRIGVDARHLDYRMKPAEKTELLASFDRQEFPILCNPMLLREGWDCPAVEVLILARPTRSLISYVQIVGRVLRTAPGKSSAVVLDHGGTAVRMGFPTDDRSDIPLDDGKPKSGSDKKPKERQELRPKPCPKCSYLKPAASPKCRACGHETIRPCKIEAADGELKLLKRSAKHEARALTERFGSKQEVWSMLMDYVTDRGYSRGMASHKYRSIFACWPKGLSDVRKPVSEELRRWLKAEQIRWSKTKKQEPIHA